MRRLFAFLMLLVACSENATWRKNRGQEMVWDHLPITWSWWSMPVPDEFREGFEYWDRRLDGGIFKEISCDDPCADVTVAPMAFDADGGGAWARTFVHTDAGFIVRTEVIYFDVFFDADSPARASIGRHEVGHVLGLMHSDRERCLMYLSIAMDDVEVKEACKGEDALVRKHYGRQ